MRRTYLLPLLAAGALLVTACGDSGSNTTDTTPSDTTQTDTTQTDTTVTDTTVTDTTATDSVADDTTETDTMVADTGPDDTTETDTTEADTTETDTTVADTTETDTTETDTTVADTTETDTTETDTTETDTTVTYDPSTQIAAVRAGSLGAVEGALVTYVKPTIGNDPGGFFVQGDQAGPAMFVKIDPSTLTPNPAVGDMVSFTVTALSDSTSSSDGQGRVEATTISDYAVLSSGASVAALVQDLSAATDLVSALDDYESELVTVVGTVQADFSGAGTGFMSAAIFTTGITEGTSLKVRIPSDDLAATDIGPGCVLDIGPVPVWRFFAQAQLSTSATADYSVTSCPAPELASATALSATEVELAFTRVIESDSVNPDGSDFTVDNGVTVSAATVDAKKVVLTVSELSAGSYTVTVGPAVTDLFATAVSTDANTATFDGPSPAPDLVISEIMPRSQGGTDNGEWIEVHNTTDAEMNLNGKSCEIQDSAGVLVESTTFDAVTIAAGGFAVFVKSTGDFTSLTTDGLFKSGGSLGNSGETLTLSCDFGGGPMTIDALSSYGGNLTAGQSIQKDPGDGSYAGPTDPTGANWCLTPTTDDTYLYFDDGAGVKKYGTPRAANVSCGN